MRSRLFGTAALAVAAILACSGATRAAGFYVTDRGVRPLGRGGAFVAGADDQNAIWYNPAGLAVAEPGILLDLSMISYDNTFTRQGYVTYSNGSNSGIINYPAVQGSPALLPIPTLVANHNFGLAHWMFAAGIWAPNAVIQRFPDTPTSPQRYSLVSLNGSLLAIVGVAASYRFNDQLSIGLGVGALVGSFAQSVYLSGCPATVTCQPEDPQWDAAGQITVGPIFAPSANAGIRYQPSRYVVFGVSGQLPTWVNSPATLQVRLPSAAYYNGAMVSGNQANVSFTLAPILRAGVEVRPTRELRMELAFVWEGWSMENQLALTPVRNASQPNGIQITNVLGVGTYDVGTTIIPRNFQDAWSIRFGSEYFQRIKPNFFFIPRAGLSYETSATSPEYTQVLTFDANKWIASIGFSFRYGRVRIDATYTHVFANTVVVDPRDARLYQVAPFRGNAQVPMDPINGGTYTLLADIFGLGMACSF